MSGILIVLGMNGILWKILVKLMFAKTLAGQPCPVSRARRVQDFWTRTRFIEYFRTRDPGPDPTD